MTGMALDRPVVGTRLDGLRRRLRGVNPLLVLALVLLVPIVAGALGFPLLGLPDPTAPNPADSMQAPSAEHLLGADRLGRDVLTRLLAGARISFLVAGVSALLSITIGIIVGTISGFAGPKIDGLIMGVNNVFLSFPSLLLAIAMVAVFGAGVWQVILAVVIGDAPQAIRMQRSLVLGLRSRQYLDAARLAAAPTWWLLLRHIVPNTIGSMIVLTSIYAANAIVTESALSFLGLGIVPPTPSWGNIMADGRAYLQEAWWISAFPGVAIVIVSIALHLLSDALRDRLDVAR